MKSLKTVESIFSSQIKSANEKEASINALESKYLTLSKKYDEMKSKTEAAIHTTVTSKTLQYEALARDLTSQVTKLLYENTKLRRYIESECGMVIPQPEYSLFTKENLGRSDSELFEKIEDLIKQNSDLKSKAYKFSASSHHGNQKADTNEHEYNNLMKRLAASEQETDRLKAARDNWKSQANSLMEKSGNIQRQLQDIQYEYENLERRAATADATVAKLKQELASIGSVVGPSEAYVERYILHYLVSKRSIQMRSSNFKIKSAHSKVESVVSKSRFLR